LPLAGNATSLSESRSSSATVITVPKVVCFLRLATAAIALACLASTLPA
jgi:hypothetical protein